MSDLLTVPHQHAPPRRGWRAAAVLAVSVVVVGVIAVGWVRFREEAKTWSWWRPPAVLNLSARQYDRGTGGAEPLQLAEAGGSGTWTQIGREWPMRWPIWSSTPGRAVPGAVPTVVFLRTGSDDYVDYALSGGP